MTLKEQVTMDMKEALKRGDKIRLSTLRMLVSAVGYAEIEKKKKELDDDAVLEVIGHEIKRRRESIEQFEKGNRADLVEKEQTELKILQGYLPAQLSDEEVEAIVKEAIDQVQAVGPGDLGKIMGLVMPKVKGRADGAQVNQIARRLLT